MGKDPETYEAALERQRTRPRPNPAVRYTGRPVMTMIAEALGPDCPRSEKDHKEPHRGDG